MHSAMLEVEAFSIAAKERLLAGIWDALGLTVSSRITSYAMENPPVMSRPTVDYWTPARIAEMVGLTCS